MAPTSDNDLQYYLYMSDDWRGPYPLPQIRSFLKLGQIDEATYAYEPQHQTQLTVSDLLAGRKVMPAVMGSQAASGYGSSGSHQAVGDGPGRDQRSTAGLDSAINSLSVLRKVCFAIGGTDGRERDDLLDDLKLAVDTIRAALHELRPSPAELRNFAVQIDRIASDIAARMSDRALTAHLTDMRDCVTHADPDEIVPAAEAVIAQIAHLARTAGDENPFEIIDDQAQDGSNTDLDAYESARFELKSLQTDLSSVKEAYGKLQETYAREQKQARRLILQLNEQLESEQKVHEGDNAELRALAAEIHDLASACGLGDTDPGVARDLVHLAEELQHTQPLSLVPVAESVLNRLFGSVGQNRDQVASQLHELTTVRAELLQLKTDMSMLRQREEQLQVDKSRIQKQLDEERGAASRVDQNARAREAQLKSTIAALKVTKELHQEVMGDLQEQLRGAQVRVEGMEHELVSARDELKGTRQSFESREQHLTVELAELSRTRSELELRQKELSGNLQTAEAELTLAKSNASQSDENESLAEALAAKVNELRVTFEQTRQRLKDQEGNASALQQELQAARQEAADLRGRSDQMASELEGARTNLDSARRRMEELQRAAARLEAERSALQGELNERKGTDSFARGEADAGHLQSLVTGLESQVATAQERIHDLGTALGLERERADALHHKHREAHSHHDDLSAERERLRGELAALHAAGVDSEGSQDLADRLAAAERGIRESGEARSDLQARLSSVVAERDRLNGELTRLRIEYEAAAVEHRAAVAAARKGQTEAAARAADYKTALETAQAEKARLGDEVEAQRRLIASDSDSGQRLGALSERLGSETTRADQLAQELERSRREFAAKQVAFEQLRDDLRDAEKERDRLSDEISRRHDLSATRDAVDASGRSRLQEALDRLREQLEREQRRSTDLEHRLETARSDARTAATRHAETASSYADAVGRTDRFSGEMAAERARHAAELVEAERRLGVEKDRARALETRLADLDGRLLLGSNKQGVLERTVAELTAERDRLARDLSESKSNRSDSEHRTQDLAARLRTTEAELADLRAENALAAEQREAVSTELVSTTGRHSRLAGTVDRLTRELAQARAHLESVNAEHEAALQAVKSQLEAEHATIAALQERISVAERERETAVSRTSGLEVNLRHADTERTRLLADAEHLRQELARAADTLRPHGDDREVVALRERLADTERQLTAMRGDLDATAERGADRLVELEQQLAREQVKAAELDGLREKLRLEAVQHSEARSALALVTVARDGLREDLARVQREIDRLKAGQDSEREAGNRLVILEGQLGSERERVSRIEADLAIARSREQVAQAGREGLENNLSKVVTDRERLLNEVDRLRGELDQVRLQMRGTAPEQQAEISALKQMLTMERERVQQLEERLADAWRRQGETLALTDGELRRRLDEADRRISKLRSRLQRERRRTTELESQLDEQVGKGPLKTQAHAKPSPLAPADAPTIDAGMGTSALRPSVDLGLRTGVIGRESLGKRTGAPVAMTGMISALGRPSVRATGQPMPAAFGNAHGNAHGNDHGNDHGDDRGDDHAGGFNSRFGRPSVVVQERAATSPRSTAQPVRVASSRLSRRRWLPYAVSAAVMAVLLAVVVIPEQFPLTSAAVISLDIQTVVVERDGVLATVLVQPKDLVRQGQVLATAYHPHEDSSLRDELTTALIAARAGQQSLITELDGLRTELDVLSTTLAMQAEQARAAAQRRQVMLTQSLADARVREQEASTQLAGQRERQAEADTITATETAVAYARSDLLRLQREIDRLDAAPAAADPGSEQIARLNADIAKASMELTSGQNGFDRLTRELAVAEADLERRQNSSIIAPTAGTVQESLPQVGALLTPGQILCDVAIPASQHVLAAISSGTAENVQVGDQVLFRVVGNTVRYSGTIITVQLPSDANSLSATPGATTMLPASSDGFVERFRHRAIISIQPDIADPASLRPGASVRVLVIGSEAGAVRRWLADTVARFNL